MGDWSGQAFQRLFEGLKGKDEFDGACKRFLEIHDLWSDSLRPGAMDVLYETIKSRIATSYVELETLIDNLLETPQPGGEGTLTLQQASYSLDLYVKCLAKMKADLADSLISKLAAKRRAMQEVEGKHALEKSLDSLASLSTFQQLQTFVTTSKQSLSHGGDDVSECLRAAWSGHIRSYVHGVSLADMSVADWKVIDELVSVLKPILAVDHQQWMRLLKALSGAMQVLLEPPSAWSEAAAGVSRAAEVAWLCVL